MGAVHTSLFLPRLAKTTIATAGILAATSGVAFAAYGPPPPGGPGQPGPGGYNCVVTSRFDPAFRTLIVGPVRAGDLTVMLRIPAYTFTGPVQVTITEPFSDSGACGGGPSGNFGLKGFHVVGGLGILIGLSNAPYGTFPHSVTMRIDETGLHNLQTLDLTEISHNHATILGQRHTEGPFTLRLRHSGEFVVLDKLRHVHVADRSRSGRTYDGSWPSADLLTTALLPAGSAAPGLGVLAPGSEATLSAQRSTALGS